jgi:hypothetical protein
MFKVLRSKALSPILIHLYAESSARTRLMSAQYPYYLLADSEEGIEKEAAIRCPFNLCFSLSLAAMT